MVPPCASTICFTRFNPRPVPWTWSSTARRLSVAYPFDPVSNVRGGVRYLKELLDRFDHRPELVLAAYNAGENAVETYGGVPPYRETVGYVKRILSWWTPALAATVAPALVKPGAP